jgi:hypothetical protein
MLPKQIPKFIPSQVIIARDSDRTILTIANDYQGNAKDFALLVPVPVAIQQQQVRVGDPKILERLDAFTAPRSSDIS